MNQCIANHNSVKRNPVLKTAQKESKKYYGDSLFEKRGNAPKNRIQKLVKIRKIPFCSLMEEKEKRPMEKKEAWTAERLIMECREKKLLGGSGNGYLIADNFRGGAVCGRAPGAERNPCDEPAKRHEHRGTGNWGDGW